MSSIWFRTRMAAVALLSDCRGIAATEFAVIVPIMMTMLFGTIEVSNGIAVDRKVTLVARTISDLPSKSASVTTTDLDNFLTIGRAIVTPYSSTPLVQTISQLYIDPTTLNARVQWSRGTSPRTAGSTVTIPTALKVAGSYLIYSETSYLYTPVVGYIMGRAGVTLSDTSYARPRQSTCVMYNTTVCTTT